MVNNWLHVSAIHQRRLSFQENMHGNHVLACFNHALHAKTEWNRQPHHGGVGDVVERYLGTSTGSYEVQTHPVPRSPAPGCGLMMLKRTVRPYAAHNGSPFSQIHLYMLEVLKYK